MNQSSVVEPATELLVVEFIRSNDGQCAVVATKHADRLVGLGLQDRLAADIVLPDDVMAKEGRVGDLNQRVADLEEEDVLDTLDLKVLEEVFLEDARHHATVPGGLQGQAATAA